LTPRSAKEDWMSARVQNVLATLAALSALLVGGAASAQEAQQIELPWQLGLATAPIGADLAEIDLGDDYVFLDEQGTRTFLELNQNPVAGTEIATVAPLSDGESWFVIFEFSEVGYVKDDEKDDLDADAMLASIREGTEMANEARREHGWAPMEIVGWHEPPHYDERTNNLSWAVIGESGGAQNVNRIVKLLGRRGVMTATLVASTDQLPAASARVDALLNGYRFRPGNTYAEYVPSTDKLAGYGLTALVVGGAGAALVKSGLLAKIWKPIAIGLVAMGAALKRFVFGGRKVEQTLEGPIS
jgi:uncharacterized membrane-anchored protein